MDAVSGFGVAGTGAIFSVSAVTTTLTTGVVGGGTGFTGASLSVEGYVSGNAFTTAGTVTARAALIDGQVTTKGGTVVFEAGSGTTLSNFLFIQGGASGTADDLVVAIGTGEDVSIALASGAITLAA